jgi:hypothetical protein
MWIFISHSTEKTDDAGRQRILDVQAALKEAAAGPSGSKKGSVGGRSWTSGWPPAMRRC